MKLDLFYEIDAPRPWPGEHPLGQKRIEQEAYAEALEQIVLADRMGFNTVWCVEHHFREGRSHMPSPEVVLGALSQITENIKLGFGVTLTPFAFTHPARIAEKVATVDILSKGRVEWGLGRSTPMEQMAFGVDRDTSRDQLQEVAGIVTGMWREEYFEYESENFSFPRRMVTPKPYQDPHPPAWVAATSKESSEIAGRNGFGLLSFAIMQPVGAMAKLIYAYREAAKNAVPLTDRINDRAAVYTLVHCVEDEKDLEKNQVWESVWWWYQNIAQFTLDWELAHLPQDQQDKIFPLLKGLADGNQDMASVFNDADMIMVGTPERIIEKMKKYADIGVDQVLCYVQFGTIPHEAVMRTIELLGKEVIPAVAEYAGRKFSVRFEDAANAPKDIGRFGDDSLTESESK